MARLHSSLGDRTSYTPDGVAKAQGLPATVYEDPAGTVLANLATYDPTNVAVPGAAIPGAALVVDAYSNRPAFWDLNDRNVLYITGNGGPLEPIHPDAQPQLTALATRVGTVEGAAAAAETPAGAQAKANAAQAAAATDAANKVATHAAATDPHGDRAYTDTGLAGRVPTSRAVTAGTGLTGGGALTADRSLAVSGLTSAHFAAASVDGSPAVASVRTLGTGAQQAAVGADAIRRQLVDAKGDLVVGTADDTVTRLAVGADGTFRLSPDPAAAGGLAWWRGDGLATGASTHERREIASAITLVSATVRFMYFTAPRNETWTQVTSVTGGTAAGATPTLCRMGVYSVDGFGDLTLVAACANDTTLWGSTNTLYTRSFTASYNAIAGQRYAAAILIVTAAALPAIVGGANLSIATTLSRAPQLSGRITGQTDLPGSVSAGSLLTLQEQHYLEVLP